jgi:hypothetical protein
MRFKMVLLSFVVGSIGCMPQPTAPASGNWQRRELQGISLEAPYDFIPSGESVDQVETVSSFKPKLENQAVDIRIDAMRFPHRTTPLTLDEFAETRCSIPESTTHSVAASTVAGQEARRSSSSLSSGTQVEGVVFIKDGVYWHVDIYCANKALAADAQRAIASIQLR